MGRRGGGGGGGKRAEELHVNVPTFFRCPISLDVMRSPVSLCTGVTYDRSSIQTWLDTGHNTCPATMQILPTTDFVPNLTLHRLIQLWAAKSTAPGTGAGAAAVPASDLIRGLQSSTDHPLPLLRKLLEIADDAARVHELVETAGCLSAIHGVLVRKGVNLEATEAAVRVLSAVLLARKENAGEIGVLSADPLIFSSLVAVLQAGSLESRIAAARATEVFASTSDEVKLQIGEAEGMLEELLRLVSDEEEEKPADPAAVDAGLSCLAAVSSPRHVRQRIVALGAVPTLGKLLARPSTPSASAEKAMEVMEAAAACTEGRAAIGGDADTLAAVVGRMNKVATERAVAVLWGVCHMARDRRAMEAVSAGDGVAKILLVMQGNCSPAARRMAGDLLRILRVNSKGCLPSYDSKTSHIMPF